MTTFDLMKKVESFVYNMGGLPSFKGFLGFPGSCCISLNDEVVHGYPDNTMIRDGDFVTIDCGTEFVGDNTDQFHSYFVDAADTRRIFFDELKHIPDKVQEMWLMTDVKNWLDEVINIIKPGTSLYEIANAFDQLACNKKHTKFFPQFYGHGIGTATHEEPGIAHTLIGLPDYEVERLKNTYLVEGQLICLEPSATLGSTETIKDKDGWTESTKDGSIAVHVEHTVLVTKFGALVIS